MEGGTSCQTPHGEVFQGEDRAGYSHWLQKTGLSAILWKCCNFSEKRPSIAEHCKRKAANLEAFWVTHSQLASCLSDLVLRLEMSYKYKLYTVQGSATQILLWVSYSSFWRSLFHHRLTIGRIRNIKETALSEHQLIY